MIQEIAILHRHASELAARKEHQAAEVSQLGGRHADLRNELEALQVHVGDLLAQKGALEQAVGEAVGKRGQLQAEVAVLEASLREFTEAAEKAEQARREEGPLLFGSESHPISRDWDSYPLRVSFIRTKSSMRKK